MSKRKEVEVDKLSSRGVSTKVARTEQKHAYVILHEKRSPYDQAEFGVRGVFDGVEEANKEARKIAKDLFDFWQQAIDDDTFEDAGIAEEAPETDSDFTVAQWKTKAGGIGYIEDGGEGEVQKVYVVQQALQTKSNYKSG